MFLGISWINYSCQQTLCSLCLLIYYLSPNRKMNYWNFDLIITWKLPIQINWLCQVHFFNVHFIYSGTPTTFGSTFFKQKLRCKNCIRFYFSKNLRIVIYSLYDINYSEFLFLIQIINNLINKYWNVGIWLIYLVFVIVCSLH